MNSQDKNTMICNLRNFIAKGETGLRDYQNDALIAVEKFMRLPNGGEFVQLGSKDTQEAGIKRGDYLEVVSATGSGKTRMFGTMAKAMDVPTLIVTPRNLLNKNTREEFCNEIGIPEKDIAIYDSKQPTAERKRIIEGNPPPKFVITSYQSLPPLVNRHELDFADRNDVHYRPFIILDEVHEGLGAKTSAIIKKLRDNVMVAGFTATDAGAANHLFEGQKPVYHLPIAEAIKRDILCNGVVTGTIDVTIDEGWIKNFASTQKGKEYRREDLERFAAAPSVLEGAIRFHLTENRDNFGKLSRLPTVFYTEGIGSARYGAERFNALAKELGVNAKAAYVSGDMGTKQYQPILEQFKKGEIQAVFNDKLLGMGFDARNATVCYSLRPSNMPHVVEQQLGRITRKQDSDYKKKYGQDKLSLAINVRADGMDPYLFGQVLGDAGVYSAKYVRKPVTWITRKVAGKDDIEAVTSDEASKTALVDSIDAEPQTRSKRSLPSGIKVHIDYKDMQSVISEANKNREGIPQKTDEWLIGYEMGRLAKTNGSKIYPIYESLEKAWEQAKEKGDTSFSAEGITLPVDKAGVFQSGIHKVFCVHKDVAYYFSTPQKTENFVTANEMKKLARIGQEKVYAIYEALETAWKKAKEKGESSFSAEGITLPVDKAGIFQNVSSRAFCLHKDVAYYFSTPQKTDEWLHASETSRTLHTTYSTISSLYEKLKIAWQEAKEKGEHRFTAEGIALPVDKAGIFSSGNKPAFCLHKDIISCLSESQKPEYFQTYKEMARLVHVTPPTISQLYDKLEKSWQQAKEKGEDKFSAEGITLPIDKAGIFQRGSRSFFCLHNDAAQYLSTPQKSDVMLAAHDMAALVNTSYPKMYPIYVSLETAWKKAKEKGEDKFSAEGITLPVDKAGIFQNVSSRAFCLHKDVASHFSTPQKTDEWLSSREMEILARGTYREVYKSLETAWKQAKEKGESSFSAAGITLPTDKAGVFQNFTARPFCLHRSAISFFSVPQKTDEWVNITELANSAHVGQLKVRKFYEKLEESWKIAKEKGEPRFIAEGITLPIDRAGIFQNGTQRPFCLNKDIEKEIVAHLKHEKPSKATFAEMVGGEKSISPGSENLKRTGRERT